MSSFFRLANANFPYLPGFHHRLNSPCLHIFESIITSHGNWTQPAVIWYLYMSIWWGFVTLLGQACCSSNELQYLQLLAEKKTRHCLLSKHCFFRRYKHWFWTSFVQIRRSFLGLLIEDLSRQMVFANFRIWDLVFPQPWLLPSDYFNHL